MSLQKVLRRILLNPTCLLPYAYACVCVADVHLTLFSNPAFRLLPTRKWEGGGAVFVDLVLLVDACRCARYLRATKVRLKRLCPASLALSHAIRASSTPSQSAHLHTH